MIIKNGRVIDPISKTDDILDIKVAKEKLLQ